MDIIILDDEQSTLDYMTSIIRDHYGDLHTIFSFSESEDLQTFHGHADLLLTDIKLQQSNGIEEAIQFLQRSPNTEVIFFTGYPTEYFEEIFCGIRPYAFLAKPIHEKRLFEHIDNIQKKFTSDKTFQFSHKGKSFSVPLDDILYIESHGRQKTIQTDRQTYVVNLSFEEISNKLSHDFARCHLAFLVNMNRIVRYSSANLLLSGEHLIPIGRKYRQDFRNKYNAFKMERLL